MIKGNAKIVVTACILLLACVAVVSADNIQITSVPPGATAFYKLHSSPTYIDAGPTPSTIGGVTRSASYDVYVVLSGYLTPPVQTIVIQNGANPVSFTLDPITPVPEFPSMALPMVLIIGMMGTVLYIRQSKGN